MSDTYKRNGGTNCDCRPGEMKAWRRRGHRSLRRGVRIMIRCEAWELMPLLREVANLWDSPGDGTYYRHNEWRKA